MFQVNKETTFILIFIKYVAMFIIFSNIIFNEYFLININQKLAIEIDNEFKENLYEADISFNKYQTNLKPIAFYYPEYNNISFMKYFNKNENTYPNNNDEIELLIKVQTKLAKNHGIFGFAIYFDLSKLNYYKNIINIFSNKAIIPFFLIWKNDEITNTTNEIIENLVNNLKQYIMSDNYIKIGKKPVISISNPSKISNIKNVISIMRKKAKLNKIGKIFIFYPFIGNFTANKFLTDFDATYDFSKVDLIEHTMIKGNILYYSGIVYKNLILNELNFNFSLYRSCFLNYENFDDYNPEKFYISNNLIFNWTISNYEQNKGILFINSWNNYKDGKYLEPDEIYGYASINSFSKSLFNLPFRQNNSLSINTDNKITIAIQAHVFYEDLMMEIINRLNLIKFKYDLFISTISKEKKEFIKKCLLNSNAGKYEIKVLDNIGRDVFPFISQMKKKYKNYKYICHIHTKKSNHNTLLGKNWRNYIYSNLFGSQSILSEILFDFEKNPELGFIFPEIYYDLKKDIHGFDKSDFFLNKPNKKYMNLILKKISKMIKVGEKIDFPSGNMFWAKTKAIYQIFNIRLKYPKELNQTNETIMHGIERIWLYLVKLNGYYYKTIFKHF